jgi:threonine dehydrogenase-like Zn-dependent dehydrogenase
MQRLLITGPREAVFEEVEKPVCAPNELIVRARVTAISTGTEIRVYRLKPVDDAGEFLHAGVPFEVPTENGYSMVGDVLEVGSDCAGFAVGDRVFVPATHREFAAMPAALAVKLPPGVPDEQAVFLSILEVAHLAIRRAHPTLGETVAIVGLGVIGLSALAYSVAYGFRTLALDMSEARLAIARRMGADFALNPQQRDFAQRVAEFTSGNGADLVIEAASVWPAIRLSMDIAAKGAKIVVVARHTDRPDFSPVGDPYLQKDLTLLVSYGHPPDGHRWDRRRSFARTLEMLDQERLVIAPMITHRIDRRDLPAFYARLDRGESEIAGVVVDWRTGSESST